MLMASHVSKIIFNFPIRPERISILEGNILRLLKEVPHLKDVFAKVIRSQFISHFKSDKKHSNSAYVMILINANGALERVKAPISEDTERIILSAFDHIKKDIYEIQ
jgi:hypothetical protein